MKLLNLLKFQLKRKTVGTLVLGKKDAFREIFFEKELVYLCEDQFSGKIDVQALVDAGLLGTRVSASQLERILVGCDLRAQILPKVLFERGLAPESALPELNARHIKEEMLELLLRNKDSFHFQQGRVPERLLREADGIAIRTPIQLTELIAELEKRLEKLKTIALVLPSKDESFVITAQGMAFKQQHPELFGLQRVLGLIDGFRNLESLTRDSGLFEYYQHSLLVESLDREYLKKVVLPELKGVSISQLSEQQAAKYLPYYQSAVKYAVDQLAARERVALVYEKLGNADQAVLHYSLMADALVRMGKTAKAVQAYQRALSLKPEERSISDKILRIYLDTAEAQIQSGDEPEAIQLLESALRLRPERRDVFRKLAQILRHAQDIERLADICDWIVVFAKKSDQPQIAIGACREVLALLPEHPVFLKKLVNVYLDLGESQKAAAELKILVRTCLKAGQPDKAIELLQKISRIHELSPELVRLRKELERGSRRRRRVSLRSARVALLLGFVVLLIGYQAWSFAAWLKVRNTAEAWGDSTVTPAPPRTSGLAPSAAERKRIEFASECEAFAETFPLSVMVFRARHLKRDALNAAEELANERLARKREILARAGVFASEGDRESVVSALKPILDLRENDATRSEALALIAKAQGLSRSAEELVEEAQNLERQREWAAAYNLYLKLLKTYPGSRRARQLSLPIVLGSVPSRAEIHRIGREGQRELLGRSPLLIRLRPDEVIQVEVSTRGHRTFKAAVSALGGGTRLFVLFRRPLQSVSLGSPIDFRPALTTELAVCATEKGPLHAVRIASGSIAWSVTRSGLKNLVSPPLASPEGIYTIWNDSEVWLLDPRSPGPQAVIKQKVKLEGFASGSPLILENGLFVVGTGRRLLQVFQRGSLQPVRQIKTSAVPGSLSRLSPSAVVALAAAGELLAVDLTDGRDIWTRRFNPPPRQPPTLLVSSLGLLTEDNHYHLLAPASGTTQRVLPLSGALDVVPDSDGKRIIALAAHGQLSALSPQTGQTVERHHLDFDGAQLRHLGKGVAVLHENRGEFLILDGDALLPRWGARTPDKISYLSANAEVVAVGTETGKLYIFSNRDNHRKAVSVTDP